MSNQTTIVSPQVCTYSNSLYEPYHDDMKTEEFRKSLRDAAVTSVATALLCSVPHTFRQPPTTRILALRMNMHLYYYILHFV